jgi:hypothetical protein
MIKNFTVPVPNELYVDNFSEGKVLELTYDGPDKILLLVGRHDGTVVNMLQSSTDPHNADVNMVVEVDAEKNPDVAYFYLTSRRPLEEISYVTITNVDGSTHEEIANPTIFDIYGGFVYNAEQDQWTLQQFIRDKRSPLFLNAEQSKQYLTDNTTKFSSNTSLSAMAEEYLNIINDYQTSGNGSIYSWRLATWDVSEVPQIPPPLITAILKR